MDVFIDQMARAAWRVPAMWTCFGLAAALTIYLCGRVRRRRIGSSRGFTLIETAIVLVIMGLLLGTGITVFGKVGQASKEDEARARMAFVEQAIIAYGMINSCLPCPADGSVAAGTAGWGQSADTNVGAYTGCTDDTCITANGIVPFFSLGISPEEAIDPWGNFFTYQLSSDDASAACTGNGTGASTRSTNLQAADGFQRVVNVCYPRGEIDIQDASGASMNTYTGAGSSGDGAAIVLVSHGPNQDGAFSADNVLQQGDASALEDENSNGDAVFNQLPLADVPGALHFDDIVLWRTGPHLIYGCGDAACGNP